MKTVIIMIPLFACLLLVKAATAQLSMKPVLQQQVDDLQQYPETRVMNDGYIVLTYDDGIAENYCAWQLAGNMMAVKFILSSSPASVVGAKVYVGNGSFPAGGNILNAPFLVSVYAADGDNGMPGTLIDSVSASVTNYEWVTVNGINALVTTDFYITITQLSNTPDCIPIGVDETLPKYYMSYVRNVVAGNPWVLSPYQDLMINALISTTVGMDEDKVSASLKISPNPANGSIKLEFPIGIKSISIYNAEGQNINEFNTSNQSTLSISTSSFISGVFYIRFTAANGDSFIRKLVVVH
jgi:hypothetical protein